MRDQLTLLRETPWDVLIVLDACRADYFRQVTDMDAEVVRAPGPCTKVWVSAVAPILREVRPMYFSANPVVDRELNRSSPALPLLSIWKSHWSYFTADRIPSVHPHSVNGVVLTWRDLGRLRRQRLVVHYLQPHSPYIGSVPLALARWGRSGYAFGQACHRLARPGGDGMDWDLLRRAYKANLALVWDAALDLAKKLPGTKIITSDHGEMLGETTGKWPRFGHECGWRHPKLYEVPWFIPSEVEGLELKPHHGDTESAEKSTEQKLEALGYLS